MYAIKSYVPLLLVKNRMIFVIIFITVIYTTILYYFLTKSHTNQSRSIDLSSIVKSGLMKNSLVNLDHTSSSTYSLDSECLPVTSNNSAHNRTKTFNLIFEAGLWQQEGSRSGPGSTLEGAYDWLRHLRTLFEHYSIRSIADIPCGDTFWQFSLREINTIEGLYFGGDISTSVIKQNEKLYGSIHQNKLFRYWDLVNCPIPTYTFKNSTHQIKTNHFDLVIVRDALQHMHIQNGLKAVRNVIMSGAKFFALSSYAPYGRSSEKSTRSIGKNESLPQTIPNCGSVDYCKLGQIKDGGMYSNNINCYPFNFPLNKAILLQPSHYKFPIDTDEMHIYMIDDELKRIVAKYDTACLEK
ncbi:hypothetical protein I4U23_024480 [Adineta vaga]|nr:hypothetical protein I4U23_024480 [Adineta vaga]